MHSVKTNTAASSQAAGDKHEELTLHYWALSLLSYWVCIQKLLSGQQQTNYSTQNVHAENYKDAAASNKPVLTDECKFYKAFMIIYLIYYYSVDKMSLHLVKSALGLETWGQRLKTNDLQNNDLIPLQVCAGIYQTINKNENHLSDILC